MYDLGDTVPLSVVIRDSADTLADPDTLTLTIQLPDLTTSSPSPVKDDVGLYHYDYVPAAAGTYIARWLGTGTNEVAYEETFTVRPAFERGLVSLDDMKRHLNKTNTTDDEELREFIVIASDMIRDLIGPVLPTTRTEVKQGGGDKLALDYPAVSITSVTEYPRAQTVDESAVKASGNYYYIRETTTQHTALVRRLGYSPYPWAPTVVVVYEAGLGQEVPPAVRHAAREIVRHLWQTQRGAGGGVPVAAGNTEWTPGQGFSMPRRAEELLSRYMGSVS